MSDNFWSKNTGVVSNMETLKKHIAEGIPVRDAKTAPTSVLIFSVGLLAAMSLMLPQQHEVVRDLLSIAKAEIDRRIPVPSQRLE